MRISDCGLRRLVFNPHSAFRIPQLPASSRHQQSNLFIGDALRINFADDASMINNEQTVCERRYFLKLCGDQKHGASGISERDELAVDELDSPDVNTARRLRDEQEFWLKIKLAPDDQLLLIAA